MKTHRTTRTLLHNIRFYILASAVLGSIVTLGLFRLNIVSERLFFIRAEQVFGFVALLYWYLALLISPICSISLFRRAHEAMRFSRRALGVSAAYFALLHVLISVFLQIGGLDNLVFLPDRFKTSFWLGTVALSILVIMTVTSFDKAVQWLTFVRWKWLHRLGYVGGVSAMLHVWMIGTHITYQWIAWTAFGALSLLALLELYRAGLPLIRLWHLATAQYLTLIFAVWTIFAIALLAMPKYVSNYHQSKHKSIIDHEHL